MPRLVYRPNGRLRPPPTDQVLYVCVFVCMAEPTGVLREKPVLSWPVQRRVSLRVAPKLTWSLVEPVRTPLPPEVPWVYAREMLPFRKAYCRFAPALTP